MGMHEDVLEFYAKFDLPARGAPQLLDGDEYTQRLRFLEEELTEFVCACASSDLPAAADALIDLTYVAVGTAIRMGLPWNDLWAEVHAANMRKIRGSSERASDDVVKPNGWQPPDVKGVLRDCVG